VPPTTAERIAATHVLVSYAGAVKARPDITRTREEARARAEEARRKVLAGEPFESIARIYSDDSTASRGGALGGFGRGVMVGAFEEAAWTLPVGSVSEIVETPFGFHVIRRDPLEEVHCQHLVVSWSGAPRAPRGVVRTKDEARTRIAEAVGSLAAGKPWSDVVRQYSDGPAHDDDGDLGWFARDQLAVELDAVAFDLDIGATSVVVETARGYHVLRRVE
jgi:parvulin-like peptidyl-prolyl isomerase